MSFKESWQREKLKKKLQRGFRGYPVATIAYYGPTSERASKVVASIVRSEGAEPEPVQKWFSDSTDVRTDPQIRQETFRFLEENAPKSVVMVERIMGCPHEEGIDYPEGETCPQCPYWANRDRFSGNIIE